jgi:hypothetical protein
MYCPICGWQNREGTKFCTRCGTNLLVIAKTLSQQQRESADQVSLLLNQYYAGRREAITGAGLIWGGLVVMLIMIASGLSAIASFWIICWMFIWGSIAMAKGVGKWAAAHGHLKALGADSGKDQRALGERPPPQKMFDSEPGYLPGTLTEGTTRKLEENSKS